MATTILVPTDFQVESLNTLKFALAEQTGPVRVILLYAQSMNDSITELLFYSPAKIIKSHTTPAYAEALDMIKNGFGVRIHELSFELLTGNNKSLCTNLLSRIKPDRLYLPKTYSLQPGRGGFNCIPLLLSSGVPVQEIDWTQQAPAASDEIERLFASAQTITQS